MAYERFTYSFICLQAPQVPLAHWPRKYSRYYTIFLQFFWWFSLYPSILCLDSFNSFPIWQQLMSHPNVNSLNSTQLNSWQHYPPDSLTALTIIWDQGRQPCIRYSYTLRRICSIAFPPQALPLSHWSMLDLIPWHHKVSNVWLASQKALIQHL